MLTFISPLFLLSLLPSSLPLPSVDPQLILLLLSLDTYNSLDPLSLSQSFLSLPRAPSLPPSLSPGVKPRYHLVPCPHCATCSNQGNMCTLPNRAQLERSFSAEATLQSNANSGAEPSAEATPTHHEQLENGLQGETSSLTLPQGPSSSSSLSPPARLSAPFRTAPQSSRSLLSKATWKQWSSFGRNKGKTEAAARPVRMEPGQVQRAAGGERYLEPEIGQECVQDPYNYAFRYDDCVVMARCQDYMTCPAHGKILLKYMAPDTVRDIPACMLS